MNLTTDDIWPRDEEHRYRLYALRHRGMHERGKVVAASPDLGGIGAAFGTAAAEGEFEGDARVGVMDTIQGSWIVNPYA